MYGFIKQKKYLFNYKILIFIYSLIFLIYEFKIKIGSKIIIKNGHFVLDLLIVLFGFFLGYCIINNNYLRVSYVNISKKIILFIFVYFISLYLISWFSYIIELDLLLKSFISLITLTSNFYFLKNLSNFNTSPVYYYWWISVFFQVSIFSALILYIAQSKFFKDYLNEILIFAGLLSFLISVFLYKKVDLYNYYLFPSKLWECLIGILIYINLNKLNSFFKILKQNTLFLIICFSTLIFYFFFFNKEFSFNPYHHFIVLLSFTFIYLFFYIDIELPKSSLSTYSYNLLLTKKSIDFFLIIFAFILSANIFSSLKKNIFYNLNNFNFLFIILSVIFTFIILQITNLIVKKIKIKLIFIFLLFLLFIFFTYFLTIFNDGFINRYPKIIYNNLINKQPWYINRDSRNIVCFGWYDDRNSFCNNYEKRNKKTIHVVGDSTIEAISPELKKIFIKNKYNYFFMNNSACYFIPDMYASFNNRPLIVNNETCSLDYQKKRFDNILNHPNSIIIIGGYLNYYLDKKNITLKSPNELISIEDAYIKNINFLLSKGYKIIQMTPGLEADFDVVKRVKANLILSSLSLYSDIIIKEDISIVEKRLDPIYKIFNKIKHPNFHVFKTYESFCKKSECFFNDSEQIFFIDNVHPSIYGSRIIVNNLLDLIEKL